MIVNYRKALKLSQEDLLGYPKEELLQLAKTLNIPTNESLFNIAGTVAKRLLETHWKHARMDGLESLPYGGNITEAMRNQDRDAIRKIQAWRAEHQQELNRQLVKEEEEKQVPKEAEDCSNDKDLVTQEDWSPGTLPEVKIRFLDAVNPFDKDPYTVCFSRESLEKWLEDSAHYVAVWLPKTQEGSFNDDGYGGAASHITRFARLPNNSYVDESKKLLSNHILYTAVPVATDLRLGNLDSVMGVSSLHGQVPGKTVYLILRDDEPVKNALAVYIAKSIINRADIIVNPFGFLNILGLDLDKDEIKTLEKTIIDDSIDQHADDWDVLHQIVNSKELSALQNNPTYRSLYSDADSAVNYVQDEDETINVLKELFAALHAAYYSGTLDSTSGGTAYEFLIQSFFPEWADDEFIELLDTVPTVKLFKAAQLINSRIPETDLDYKQGVLIWEGSNPVEHDEYDEDGGPTGYPVTPQYSPSDSVPPELVFSDTEDESTEPLALNFEDN